MLSRDPPRTVAHPALLLIEPASTERSERRSQLERSNYTVTPADCAKDIFLMRHAFRFSVVVMDDTMGEFALRASAQLVRSQWPYARILILGHASRELDDYLYDDSVVHAAGEAHFCEAVDKQMGDQWRQQRDGIAKTSLHGRLSPRQIASWIVQESDPSKTVNGAPVTRDWPSVGSRTGGIRR